MVAKMFSKMGYSVAITKGSGDEGIDLYMKNKKGERVGVQCKKWKGIIGQSIIRDFYGSLMHAHLKKGFIVTTGRFSKAANAFTRGKSITLIDGNKLREILGEVWLDEFGWSKGEEHQYGVTFRESEQNLSDSMGVEN